MPALWKAWLVRHPLLGKPMHSRHQSGLTLLELLIAVAVFSLLSVLVYGGLGNLITQQNKVQAKQQALMQIQTAAQQISQDIAGLIPKSVINPDGQLEPSIYATNTNQTSLTSHVAFALDNRFSNHLQRINYYVKDGVLWRSYQPINLSQALMPARARAILHDVRQISWHFIDHQGNTTSQWPVHHNDHMALPISIGVDIQTASYDTIKLTFNGLG